MSTVWDATLQGVDNMTKKVRLSNCVVFNAIKNMPNTLGITIEQVSNAAMIQTVPLRQLQRFWFCGQQNVYTCKMTNCLSHVDYKEE